MGIIDAIMTSFSDGDLNIVEHVWRELYHMRDVALRRDGSSDPALALTGWEQPRTVQISNTRIIGMHIF